MRRVTIYLHDGQEMTETDIRNAVQWERERHTKKDPTFKELDAAHNRLTRLVRTKQEQIHQLEAEVEQARKASDGISILLNRRRQELGLDHVPQAW